MARRVSLNKPDEVIQCLEEYGGAIVTGFSSVADVQKVNADATPFIDDVAKDVSTVSQKLELELLGFDHCVSVYQSLLKGEPFVVTASSGGAKQHEKNGFNSQHSCKSSSISSVLSPYLTMTKRALE